MGITGLLSFLEKSSKKTNIREFSGCTVAIDTYCWLHKGIFSCAEKLMMGQTTNIHIMYCMKYINMLLKYNIKPILVFDGRRLPAKEQTEIKRRELRKINHRKAVELMQMGQVTEGRNLLKRAVDITHEIALELIKHCQNENIDCIVAPYEADAQLAYLNINKIADVVITEDSDLILFGCKKVFFKMDLTGNGVLIEENQLHLAMNMKPEEFNIDKLRYICILSGCDYLSSLPGIGLGKARKFITKNTDHNIHRALTRIGSVLNMKSLIVTQEYRDAFILADITFKYQLVFCPLQRKQVRLNVPTVDITEAQLEYAGKELKADLALQLALGNCDPSTLKMLHNYDPDKIERKRKWNTEIKHTSLTGTSIWSSNYKLKTKNDISLENAMKSVITTDKGLNLQNNSPKRIFLSPKLHSSTMQCDKLQNSEYKNLNENENTILDMYKCQNAEETASPKQKSREFSPIENNISPELVKQKNPFVKQISDLTTSPSVLSNGNCHKRGRNLMRIRQTTIDENTMIESKYFFKQDNEHDISELENNIDQNLRNTKCNIIPNDQINVHNNKTKREEIKVLFTRHHAENASSIKNSNDAFLNQDECLITLNDNVPLESKKCLYSNNEKTEISPTHRITVNKNYVSDNLLVSLNSNDIINYKTRNILQEKLSNTKICQTSLHNKLENFKKQSSSNLITSKVKPIKKQMHQNKRLSSVVSQQSLLQMYGFQKRPTLKH